MFKCIFQIEIRQFGAEIKWEAVVKLSDDFNGADLRNVCTEAGENVYKFGKLEMCGFKF